MNLETNMGGGALNRENLKQNGIRFHETVASHKDLLQTCRSPQIAFLRDGLLDFDGILSLASYVYTSIHILAYKIPLIMGRGIELPYLRRPEKGQ